jgi:hypothetical protein
VAKTKNDKDEETTTADPGAGQTGYAPTPGQEPGPSAATLEEALRQQDAAARDANAETTAEQTAEAEQVEAETNAAIEEAGKAQEARDDAVYGREPGGEDRRVGKVDPDAIAEPLPASE